MKPSTMAAALAIAALLLAAVLLRYEVVPLGEGGNGYAYVLDRWTGGFQVLAGRETIEVKPRDSK